MARKGRVFSEQDVRNIIRLLRTEMTVKEIAERLGCSRSAVIATNRKFNIREYAGHRTQWQLVEATETVA